MLHFASGSAVSASPFGRSGVRAKSSKKVVTLSGIVPQSLMEPQLFPEKARFWR